MDSDSKLSQIAHDTAQKIVDAIDPKSSLPMVVRPTMIAQIQMLVESACQRSSLAHEQEKPTDKCVDERVKLDIVRAAYGWSFHPETGEIWALVAGDQGFEETGIFIPLDQLATETEHLRLVEALRKAEADAKLAARRAVEQLESYLQHKGDCAKWMHESGHAGVTFSQPFLNHKQPCTCGLADQLRIVQEGQ